jgi:hypothetical protein
MVKGQNSKDKKITESRNDWHKALNCLRLRAFGCQTKKERKIILDTVLLEVVHLVHQKGFRKKGEDNVSDQSTKSAVDI